MKHVVMFSGGAGSAYAAKRVAEQHGTDDLILLFADTKIEDDDLYRFVEEASGWIGGRLVWIAEGRTPFEVMRDERMVGNARFDPCSKLLKREFMLNWLQANCDRTATTIYLGIDWSEVHRFDRARPRWESDGWKVAAPLCDPPYVSREDVLAILKDAGIEPPRLYRLGFAHNNCGGFCIKAGQASFARLLQVFPDRYAAAEAWEEDMSQMLGKKRTILVDRKNLKPGEKRRPLSLREFRERLQAGESCDQTDVGGCGCVL